MCVGVAVGVCRRRCSAASVCVGGIGDGVNGVVVSIVFDNVCLVFDGAVRWRRCVSASLLVCVSVVVRRRRCMSAASVAFCVDRFR